MTGIVRVTRKISPPISCALLIATCLAPSSARAADDDLPKVAIQRRELKMAHELRLSVGALPLDAFQKGWSGSLSYTAHVSEYVGWEVFQLSAALLTSTNLRELLIDTFAVPPDDFAAPRFVLTTGLELTPFHGKQVMLNDMLAHQSFLVGAYAGVIFGDRQTLGNTFSDVRPAVGLGLGYRFFLSKVVSLRADVRDLISFRRAIRANESVKLEQVLMIQFGLCLNLWRDDA